MFIYSKIFLSLECNIAGSILAEHLVVGFTWKSTHT